MSVRRVVASSRFAEAAAELIATRLRQTPRPGGLCALALTGGRTVRPVYEHLAGSPGGSIPWHTVAVYFGDERAVPPDHPDSNFRLAHEALLSRIPVAPARIHRMEAEREDLETAARDYERILPATLDLLLLSVGSDGHIASLFPGAPAIGERIRRVVPAAGGEPKVARLTITPRVIRESVEVLVLAAGAAKRDAVTRALEGPPDPLQCPAQLVRHATWILDREAAAGLRGLSPTVPAPGSGRSSVLEE
jgi:6-phosphogluconolactonase